MQQISDEKWRPAVHPGTDRQFGRAARWTPPLVSLLEDPAASIITKYAHPVTITALAIWGGTSGREVVVSADREGRVRLWSLRLLPATPALCQLANLQAHSGPINCLELHNPTGMLASAGCDGVIRLWQIQSSTQQSGTQRPQLARRGCLAAGACAAPVAACAFSSCGAFLASCSLDGSLRLWEVGGDRQLLGEVQLQASSVAFAPGDDAALLVAASGEGEGLGPLLLDLHQVPACHRYCTQLAASQQRQEAGSSCRRTGGTEALPAAAAAGVMHPAAAMWLPGSLGQASAAGGPQATADAPVSATPGAPAGRLPAAGGAAASAAGAAAAAVLPGSTPSAAPGSIRQPQCRTPRRQAGSIVAFSRKRQRQGRQEEAEEAAAGATAGRLVGGPASQGSPCSWLPGGDSALRPPAPAAGWGGGLFGAWSAPLSPASPLSTAAAPSGAAGEAGESADGFGSGVPFAAVAAHFWAPCKQSRSGNGSAGDSRGGGGGMFDPATQRFVYRQTGHMSPVHWLLPLPGGVHVLTAAADGEAKVWLASGASSSSSSSSSAYEAICCTLLPALGDKQKSPFGCRPALSGCGRYLVGGLPSGTLACWDLHYQQYLQGKKDVPLDYRGGNAAAAACGAHAGRPVTAVAVGTGDTLLVSGDSAGQLVVRWR